jgi:glutamate synthase domain-containing protein 1
VFGDELRRCTRASPSPAPTRPTFDNALQFLAVNGRTLPALVLMMVPEAWQKHSLMVPDLKAFYEYHACLMEPWDGPGERRRSPTAT